MDLNKRYGGIGVSKINALYAVESELARFADTVKSEIRKLKRDDDPDS